jgi:hypothetical protein
MSAVLYEEALGACLADTMSHMCKSGQFTPNPTWVIPCIEVHGHGCEVSCFHIENHDESSWWPNGRHLNVTFDTITGVSNMRNFNAKKLLLDHHMEERTINRTLHDFEGDGGRNCWFRFERASKALDEDLVVGVADCVVVVVVHSSIGVLLPSPGRWLLWLAMRATTVTIGV